MRAGYGFGDGLRSDVEAAFAQVVLGTHEISVLGEVLYGGEVLDVTVPLQGGQVDYDRGAARLARASVQIADPVRLPLDSADVYTPFGYELRLWRGVKFAGRHQAPTYIGAGTLAADIIAVTPALPTAARKGDFLLLTTESANEAMTLSDEAGGTWTEVGQAGTGVAGAANATRLGTWWS